MRQFDEELGHAGVVLAPRVADVRVQLEGSRVVALDERDEPAHAFSLCAMRRAVEQRTAEAASLPAV